MKYDFKAAITDFKGVAGNVKKSGFLFYKNVADKEKAKQEQQKQEAPRPPSSPFRRSGGSR